jgi:hypothetical protein
MWSSFCYQTIFSRLTQIDWVIVRLIIFKIAVSVTHHFEFWSEQFSQRVAGPRALA